MSTTAGGLSQTPVSGSGDVSQVIGIALSADVVDVEISLVLVEVQ